MVYSIQSIPLTIITGVIKALNCSCNYSCADYTALFLKSVD